MMRAFSLRFLVVAVLSFVAGYAQLHGLALALFVACWAVAGFIAVRVKLREYERRAVGAKRPWRVVLEINGAPVTKTVVDVSFRALTMIRHPDVAGGSHEAMAELNAAKVEAYKELGL